MGTALSPLRLGGGLANDGEMNWYYANGGERVGPLEKSAWDGAVRRGEIGSETLVWNETLPGWIPYSQFAREYPGMVPMAIPQAGEMTLLPSPSLRSRSMGQGRQGDSLETVGQADYTIPYGRMLSDSFTVLKGNWFKLALVMLGGLMLAGISNTAMEKATALAVVPFWGVIPIWIINLIVQIGVGNGIAASVLWAYREGRVDFSDFSRGFRWPVLRITIPLTIIYQVGMVLSLLAGVFLLVAVGIVSAENIQTAWKSWPPETWLAVFLVWGVMLVPLAYIIFCWMFATFLALDYEGGFWETLRASRDKALLHPWKISWFLMLAFMWVVIVASVFVGVLSGLHLAGIKEGAPVVVVGCLAVFSMLLGAFYLLITFACLYETIYHPGGRGKGR